MANAKIIKLLNQQVELEAQSSFQYLAMASWMENQGFHGAAKYLYAQSDEERMHMLKLFHYVNDCGGTAKAPAVKLADTAFKSFTDVFENVLKHEQKITKSINKIVEACMTEKDFSTFTFLQWYVNEQLEEENQFLTILDKVKIAGNKSENLYHIDNELGNMAANGQTAAQ